MNSLTKFFVIFCLLESFFCSDRFFKSDEFDEDAIEYFRKRGEEYQNTQSKS
jgi:hypothetical protein